MEKEFFGTDGIRGRVGESPMTADFVLKLGRAAGRVLAARAQDGSAGMVLIGKDTRSSGYMFESALEAGFSAAGVNVRLLGPLPTPGIAHLTRAFRAQAGVVISASHNAYHDNGIKLFGPDGRKLNDETEQAIEAELRREFITVDSAQLGNAKRITDAAGRYAEFCKNTVSDSLRLSGLTIVMDCANGAGYQVGPGVLEDMGATVIRLGTEPDGLNINREVGSTHPAAMQAAIKDQGADMGIALDGDGDRVILADHHGELVDGDELVYIIALARQRAGLLKGPVVGTLMSNLGLAQAMEKAGIEFHRAKVGDRHVLAMLDEKGGIIGGESSGHILCLDKATTGDGIVSALQVLAACVDSGQALHDLKQGMTKYPQHMINVRVTQKPDLTAEGITRAVQAAEQRLGDAGRVLLRPSGTEPVVRVMVEGMEMALVKELAAMIAGAVEQASS